MDNNGDSEPDVYQCINEMRSPDDWKHIVSLRLGILAYSGDESGKTAADEVTPVAFDPILWSFPSERIRTDPKNPGAAPLFVPPDRRIYRFLSTTVATRRSRG